MSKPPKNPPPSKTPPPQRPSRPSTPNPKVNPPSKPDTGGRPSGPRLSDRALVRIFAALPVGLGVVLAIATAVAGRGA